MVDPLVSRILFEPEVFFLELGPERVLVFFSNSGVWLLVLW